MSEPAFSLGLKPTLVLFRRDLRLDDHPALAAAIQRAAPIIPVYIHDESLGRPLGGASRWWLHHSLSSLKEALEASGFQLVLRRGAESLELEKLLVETGAAAVYWNRRYDPAGVAADTSLKASCQQKGLDARSFAANLLLEPQSLRNRQGAAFQVFTPFWRHCLSLELPAPVPAPSSTLPLCLSGAKPSSLSLTQLGLLSRIPWAKAFPLYWQPGEQGAQRRLEQFLSSRLSEYDTARDIPAVDGSSGLSPHLHFGELSPRRVYAELRQRSRESGVFPSCRGEERFLAELGWREFAYHLLFHFPHTSERPLRAQFESFPWAEDPDDRLLKVWQQGRTGYPIVDAGMRQLWETGWMHNRVRMVAGSFLVKHLRLHWRKGAAWFHDTLVDADPASNTLGWQWVAGCGADASPYFRIFNPVLQGEKFDSEGVYVRRWVPELSRLPEKYIHRPWEAPVPLLLQAGVRLGENYPGPVVDHAKARVAALDALARMRG